MREALFCTVCAPSYSITMSEAYYSILTKLLLECSFDCKITVGERRPCSVFWGCQGWRSIRSRVEEIGMLLKCII